MNSNLTFLCALAIGFIILALTGCQNPAAKTNREENILAAAKLILENAPIRARDIKVKIKNGVVTIEGEVEDATQKRLASESVKEISGVEQVINEIAFRERARTGLEELNDW